MTRVVPVIQRIALRCVDENHGYETPCAIFTGFKDNKAGYGRVRVGSSKDGTKRSLLVHRVTWEDAHGPIPGGMHLHHLCEVPACANPEHLELLTAGEHIRLHATLRRPTRCPQGHAYAGDNLYINPRGARLCRACNRARAAQRCRQRREKAA